MIISLEKIILKIILNWCESYRFLIINTSLENFNQSNEATYENFIGVVVRVNSWINL